MGFRHCIFGFAALFALAACSSPSGDPVLMHAASASDGPDEFSIIPNRPLEMPESLTALPEPTPGGTSRTEARPMEDAVAALGGNPALLGTRNIPAADSALVSRASRFGVDTSIRARLEAEDLEFRQQNRGRLLERLFSVNVYHRAYRSMSLDRHAELERWRARGLQTPAAPPRPGN